MKRIIFCIVFFGISLNCFSQTDIDSITHKPIDDRLLHMQNLGEKIISASSFTERRNANYAFIKELTNYLNQQNSFSLPLDSLRFISVQQPSDSAFRVFTWQMETAKGLVRHYGAIQMNTHDLKLIPLIDRSDEIQNPQKYVGDNQHWFGAIYYDIQAFNTNKGKAYLLYGLDTHNPLSNKKILDVLYISKTGDKLLFGAPIFPHSIHPKKQATRFILEYKENAAVRLQYDAETKYIIFDHLVPIDEANEGIYANYVPDGSFDALAFDKERFHLIDDAISITPITFADTDPKTKTSDTIYKPVNKKEK